MSPTHSPKQTAWFAVLADDDPAWRVRAEGGLLVADLEASDFTVQTDADHAHLIAAAPELYEALIALVDQDLTYNGAIIGIPTSSHADAIDVVNRARAALSKARPSNRGEA